MLTAQIRVFEKKKKYSFLDPIKKQLLNFIAFYQQIKLVLVLFGDLLFLLTCFEKLFFISSIKTRN